ncbi:2-keto-4-pentenoate hydratase [Tsuneonella sp. YG55]|uniref:2-keto-4-pentenoate hydratase n=2 Tax=Tsuneonella litorea TaxID=2976475 RepID=A0A9X2W049_9SPHN|nr:2-keto-4-pentenoate hydratase [Tsuneonella litorea]
MTIPSTAGRNAGILQSAFPRNPGAISPPGIIRGISFLTPVSFFVKIAFPASRWGWTRVTVQECGIAQAFVDARRKGTALARYPGNRPESLSAAYEIQNRALSLWDRAVGGWKVGKINPPDDARLGANRLAGPVFADLISWSGDAPTRFEIFREGFAAVEAEFMLRVGPTDGPVPADRNDAVRWIDEIRIGIEVASSPYAAINADGPCVTISDHGNNAGLLLGPKVPHDLWAHLDQIEVSMEIDGSIVGQATTATMLDGPFGAAVFLFENLLERGITPQAGWWISSGAITGVHPVSGEQLARARFSGVGEVSAFID